MNKTLYGLAYRNIQKYKKHYLFTCLILIFVTIFFHSYIQGQQMAYESTRICNERDYGTWYVKGKISDPEAFDNRAYQYGEEHPLEYGYTYQQSSLLGYETAYASDDFFPLTNNKIIEGSFPKKTDEIAVSKKVIEEQGLKLNEHIEADQDYWGHSSLKIVGIIELSQDDVFPDIYTANSDQYIDAIIWTNRSLYVHNGIESYSQVEYECNLYDWENFNQYGYDHSIRGEFQLETEQVWVLIGGIIVSLVIIIVLSSSNLKQRTREFALLRGIGMTNKQLFVMEVYEYVFCILFSLIIGTILSFGVLYVIASMLREFVYMINSTLFIRNFGILFVVMTFTLFYPAFKSSKTALSGTFDASYKFQYIQIRYRKLLYQNKFRLAKREMRINKKIHVFLFVVIFLHSMSYLINYIDDEIPTQGEQTYAFKENVSLWIGDVTSHMTIDAPKEYKIYSKTVPISYEQRICNIEINTIDQRVFQEYQDPPSPLMNNQAYINQYTEIYEYIDGVHTGYQDAFYIGDILNIDGQSINVIGSLPYTERLLTVSGPQDHYPIELSGLFVNNETYQSIEGEDERISMQIFYDDDTQRDEYLKELKALYGINKKGIRDTGEPFIVGYSSTINFPDLTIHPIILYISTIISFLLCYSMNRNEIMNHMHDYHLYRLIGMTKKDLLIKQVCKALLISLYIVVTDAVLSVFMLMYVHKTKFPFELLGIISLMTVIVCLLIYALPIRIVYKNNILEDLRHVE